LAPGAAVLFKPSDLRLNFYAPEFPFQVPNPSGRLRKYAYKYTQFGLQLPELYLLRAEASARLNDLSGAKKDLETLREHRMPADVTVPDQIAGNKQELVKYIFEERIREFAMEGYRWFDMRRASVDPIFSGSTYTHILFNFNEATGLDAIAATYVLRQERLTLRLPLYITNANPGMINNP
jgi:starch-binding outer membrane protein, SusD/RagB family